MVFPKGPTKTSNVLYDADGNPVLVSNDGARQVAVIDEEALATLRLVLLELRKLNMLVSFATDIELDLSDTE